MTFGSNFVGTYLFADRLIGELLRQEAPGLVLSIDIGGSLFDVIARNFARSMRHKFVGSPSRWRHRAERRSRSLRPRAADVVTESVFFGRVDGTLSQEDVAVSFETYGPRTGEYVGRSIDSWGEHRPTLRLIHFGDPGLTLDQLAGATGTIGKDRPVLTFYTSGLEREALLAELERFQYRVWDAGSHAVTRTGADALEDFGWIAAPAEKIGGATAWPADLQGSAAFAPSRWQEIMERNASPRQHRSPALFGLQTAGLQLSRKIEAGDVLAEDDCYPTESEGETFWRWLGPRPQTRIAIPCVLPGAYDVDIGILASHLNAELGGCRIIVDGREVRTAASGATTGTIRFTGQVDSRSYTGYMPVELISPGGIARAGNDPRGLRLSIQSISVAPCRS